MSKRCTEIIPSGGSIMPAGASRSLLELFSDAEACLRGEVLALLEVQTAPLPT
jgi:hypothetical protein